jgi:hypothetical protein
MGFPPNVAERALLDCGRHCCICHKFCGFKIELHHIIQKADGGEDTYENCIPLCLDCHAEVKAYNPKHPKGRKYTESELQGHRDRWYEKVRSSYAIIANPDYIKLDSELFTKIRELLPSGGAIRFMRFHDYAGSFRLSEHDDLEEFLYQCEKPEFEFLDTDLEGFRVKLAEQIKKFVHMLGDYTFPLRRTDELWNRLPPEPERDFELIGHLRTIAENEEDFQKMMDEQRKHLRQAREEMNSLANEICSTYDEFIRLGRRKLGV